MERGADTHTAAMADQDETRKPKGNRAACISVMLIVVSAFCECFSFISIRGTLMPYFKLFFNWDDNYSTTVYYTFVGLSNMMPLLGAILADTWLGKFITIVFMSIVYIVGQGILTIGSINDMTDANKDGMPDDLKVHIGLTITGLILIALGTGFIKPCMIAFGGDQFQDHQEKRRSVFFSVFFMSITGASLLSTFTTPLLRRDTCGIYTKQRCYPLAFGVPIATMALTLIVFVVGIKLYKRTKAKGNIILKFFISTVFAVWNRFRHRSTLYPRRAHWMDWAEEKYDKLLIAQVKMVLKVLFLYLPLPMFWALLDQHGLRWILQATFMDGDFGTFNVLPDQMQTIKPILILIMVPVLGFVIYPLISKCKLNFTPLRRMTVGMFLVALAYLAAAVLQIQIENSQPKFPSSYESQLKFINLLDRPLDIKAGKNKFTLETFTANKDYLTFDQPFELSVGPEISYNASFLGGTRTTMIVIQDGPQLWPKAYEDLKALPGREFTIVRIFNGFGSTLNILGDNQDTNTMSQYFGVTQGIAQINIMNEAGDVCVYSQDLGTGRSYTLLVLPTFTFGQNCQQNIKQVLDINPNSIHMAWQIPQYLLLTTGEAMFYVTGLEFSYSQAPSNMKSVVQAAWLLGAGVGFIILIILDVTRAPTLHVQWAEYLLLAGLVLSVCVIFGVMAYFYTYTDAAKTEAQLRQTEPEDKKRKSLEMVRKDSEHSSSDEDDSKHTKF